MKTELNLFDIIIILLKKKITIIVHFIVISIIALAVAMSMPLYYKSTTTFIPQGGGGGGGLFALIGENISADLIGELPFSKRQYITILNSTSIKGELVGEFGLIEHYGYGESSLALHSTMKTLNQNIEISVEEEGGLGITDVLAISITAVDKDNQLAADMANFLFRRMEEKVLELHQSNYQDLGSHLQSELDFYSDSLSIARDTLATFMKENQVYSINEQVEMVLATYGAQKAELISVETRLDILKNNYSSSNAEVRLLEEQKDAIENNLRVLENSTQKDVFVGLENSIDLGVEYSDLRINVEIYSQLQQILIQQIKQAKMKGGRNFTGAYLLHEASPALYKFKPKRAFVVLGIIFPWMTFVIFVIVFVGLIKQTMSYSTDFSDRVEELKSALKK